MCPPASAQNQLRRKRDLYKSEPISDSRIKIRKLITKEKYKVEKVSDTKLKFEKSNPKAKDIINIINVYAPTSKRAKKFPGEIQKIYNDLHKLFKEMDKISISSTITAGDFNAKIGKKNGSEKCIGQWSRGRRNDSRSKLAEFCEMSNKVIVNSCFQHPAKHITTWSQKRINPTTKIVTNTYNHMDYIILDQKQKYTLIRS